jgi:uncharacterized protein YukE
MQLGADVGALNGLSTAMEQAAATLESLVAQIGAQVNQTWWQGPASQRFQQVWATQYQTAMNGATAFLRAPAGQVREEANQQTTKSGTASAAAHAAAGAGVPAALALVSYATRAGSVSAASKRAGSTKRYDTKPVAFKPSYDAKSGVKAKASDTRQSGNTTTTQTSTRDRSSLGRLSESKTVVERSFGAKAGERGGQQVPKKPEPTRAKAGVVLAKADFFNHRTSSGVHGEGAGTNGSWSADAGPVAETTGSAKAVIDKNGASAKANVSARAMVEAGAQGEVRKGELSAGASVRAGAGARASVGGEAAIGKDGAKLAAKVDGFAGAEAAVKGNVNVGGVDATGRAAAMAGIGLKADAGAELSMKKVGVHVGVGAAFGVGAEASLKVEVDPSRVVRNVDRLADEAAKDVGEAVQDAGATLQKVSDSWRRLLTW